ncbi:MAG: ATP-binding cassette domain-containing protein [Clostridiales bacterium]|nr:ATP-binding cassette domain-containing protein [Clostridiales bacterium]
MSETIELLDVKNLVKHFPTGERGKVVRAVDGVSFKVYKGETLGVVGESGCGKTTTGRLVLKLLEKTEGEIIFKGINLSAVRGKELRGLRKGMQIIFQDPYASLDPRKTVFQTLEEPFRIHYPRMSKAEIAEKAELLIRRVGLRQEHILRYPHEFSGGQRQRIGIARAIALNPEFVVCDEPVSALDVSIQAQVINLMRDIKDDFNLTYMFISHDLRIIKHICDRVMVMYLGGIVELGTKRDVYEHRRHPYTKALLSAIPRTRRGTGGKAHAEERIILAGDIPSPVNPPAGCPFHPRCRDRVERCGTEKPALRTMADGSLVACHLDME